MITSTLSTIISLFGVASLTASPLSEWYQKPTNERGAIPAASKKIKLDTPEAIKQAKTKAWQAYKEAAIKNGWDKAIPKNLDAGIQAWVKDKALTPKMAKVGDKTMPYIVLQVGKKPKNGWPLYITLHGGGGNARAKGPHSWSVNSREWQTQMQLTLKLWKSPGIYVIPRMADDREGRWYYGYNQIFIDRIIQQAILFNDVNPNKMFLQGISEGGYAAFRLGSLMADRWAGSSAMAAAEPIGNAPPENLKHVAFRCDIGEKDTMFDRHILARNYFKRLTQLAKENPGYYKNFHNEQKGRGHGIEYKTGPEWVSKHTRTAVPSDIVWTVINQHDRHRQRMYWLALDGKQTKLPLKLTAAADKKTNTINITANQVIEGKNSAATGISLRVYLSDALVDMNKPVTIKVNGKQISKAIPKPSMEAIVRSIAERGDPTQVFPAMFTINL